MQRPIVMGRKTWDSLGGALPQRRNIVMSRTVLEAEVEQMNVDEVLALAESEDVFIIGGGEIYTLFMEHAKEIRRTIVHTAVEGADTFAPTLEGEGFYLIGERRVEAGPKDEHDMTFQHWIR